MIYWFHYVIWIWEVEVSVLRCLLNSDIAKCIALQMKKFKQASNYHIT